MLYGAFALVIIWVLIQLRPLLSFASDILTPRAALQTETIAIDTAGTHWSESSLISSDPSIEGSFDLAAGASSGTALVWSQAQDEASDVFLQLASGTGYVELGFCDQRFRLIRAIAFSQH